MKSGYRQLGVLMCSAMLGAGAIAGCQHESTDNGSSNMAKQQMMSSEKTITQTATGPNMERVSTLVQLIKAADLADTLNGAGPFTVFAPTNAAFDKMPPGTVDDLMKPENKDKLRAILLYHVHPGNAIMAADAKDMNLSTADDDKTLKISVNGDTVMVNNAKVVKADIVCKNGVIHWIDKVLMPPQ